MPGKYDPDGIFHKTGNHTGKKKEPVLIPFMTDAEWYASPKYLKMSKESKQRNK